jgi:hypothetical protein
MRELYIGSSFKEMISGHRTHKGGGKMIGFKLFRLRKDGSLGPLFINRKLVIKDSEWLPAEDHPTPGYQHRMGWHVMAEPKAPHLTSQKETRVWKVVEIEDVVEYTRPASQGGKWFLAKRMKVLGVPVATVVHNYKEGEDETVPRESYC